MPNETNGPPEAKPQPAEASAPGPWWAGLTATCLEALNRLTNERLLLLVVVGVFAFSTVDDRRQRSERELYLARVADERGEREQRHCDQREEKQRTELTTFFAAQTDLQRKHDAAREDKQGERLGKVESVLALVMARLEAMKKP